VRLAGVVATAMLLAACSGHSVQSAKVPQIGSGSRGDPEAVLDVTFWVGPGVEASVVTPADVSSAVLAAAGVHTGCKAWLLDPESQGEWTYVEHVVVPASNAPRAVQEVSAVRQVQSASIDAITQIDNVPPSEFGPTDPPQATTCPT
jgi:hypothetical protein